MSGYLRFTKTGVAAIDAILRALETAGTAYHHTSEWTDGPDDGGPSYCDLIQQAANAAASSQSSAPAWMPIETAPNDGTFIDLWSAEFGRLPSCHWGLPHHSCGEDGPYCDSEWHSLIPGWIGDWGAHIGLDDLTHWMPLPAPPKEQ